MKSLKSIFTTVFPWGVVLLIAWLFYRALEGNLHKLEGIDLSFDGWAVLGMISFLLAVIMSGILWGALLSQLSNKKISSADAIRIHSASWLLKYIPGQVGSYVNKVTWGSGQGLSKKTVSTSFIYENVLMVIAGVILSFPVFLLFKNELSDNLALLIPILMIIPMLVVLSRKLFYNLLNTAFRFLKKKPFQRSDFLPGSILIKYQVGYFLPRLLNGIGFVFIVQSLLPLSPSMYIGVAATYILASIVGLLAFFVPGGLGVREAVIVAFLSVYFPVEQAIIIALVARLYATISDVGVGVVYISLNKGKLRQQ